MSTAFSLDVIRVARPCPADWDRMAGDDRVRHCGLCRKNVYNLSAMNRPEAEDVIASAGGDLCARLYRRTDGLVMTAECPASVTARRRWWFGFAGGTVTMVLAAVGLWRMKQQFDPDPPVCVMGDIAPMIRPGAGGFGVYGEVETIPLPREAKGSSD